MSKNKIDNKEQIEKAINKLPYSLGKLASEMLDAYLADDREKYIALANQFDSENAEKAAEDAEIQRALKHAKEFASLIIPYIQSWLAPKLPQKTDDPNLVAEKVVGNQKVSSASAKSKAK
ncbi:MAG: hypothetical protein J6T79_04365 [Verrucomicrobia bacterium]|nr:hypothetical protein [Verrucomicrobiota bacterium]